MLSTRSPTGEGRGGGEAVPMENLFGPAKQRGENQAPRKIRPGVQDGDIELVRVGWQPNALFGCSIILMLAQRRALRTRSFFFLSFFHRVRGERINCKCHINYIFESSVVLYFIDQ